jgi:hypothetical protein
MGGSMHPTSAVRDFSRFAGNLASGFNAGDRREDKRRAREEKETIGSEKPERDVIVFRARFYHPHTSTF